jgi:hypothetical protein
METSTVQSIKLAIASGLGLSKDTLHVYVGLLVLFGTALASRRPLRSFVPWLAVLAVALAGEVVDGLDDIHSHGHWRWAASLHDIINTMVWPSVIVALARFTSMFGSGRDHSRT